MNRWLKATDQVRFHFDERIALSYWRSSGDWRAARMIAYSGSPETIALAISEFAEQCNEGWIIAKAVARLKFLDEAVWLAIQSRHPVTYLYLCSRMMRSITREEAFEIASRCLPNLTEGQRGLAIWAVGQLGMVDVLDRLLKMETINYLDDSRVPGGSPLSINPNVHDLAEDVRPVFTAITNTEADRPALSEQLQEARQSLLLERLARSKALADAMGPTDPEVDMKAYMDAMWGDG